jgi:hypothetical protein
MEIMEHKVTDLTGAATRLDAGEAEQAQGGIIAVLQPAGFRTGEGLGLPLIKLGAESMQKAD